MSNPYLKQLTFEELFQVTSQDDISRETQKALDQEIIFRMNAVVGDISNPEALSFEERVEETCELIAAKEESERRAFVEQIIRDFDQHMRRSPKRFDA
jgi:hypothetical protein